MTDYPSAVVTFAAVMDRKRWDKLPADVQKVMDELADEIAGWTGTFHDNQNVKGALDWAVKEQNLKVVSLDDGEQAKWDQKLAPLVAAWVKQKDGEGLPAGKYVERLRELRDQFSRQ